MTQSDHSTSRGPKRRGDTTHPASTRSSGDRRPYPTASTTTRVSPATPGSANTRSRARGSAATPIPATVWTAGPAPIDLDTAWPEPIITTIVSSFSEPGGRVAFLPWPTSDGRAPLAPVGADGVIDSPGRTAPATEPDHALADALAATEELNRTGRVVRLAAGQTATGPSARPFWADLVGDSDHSSATAFSPPLSGLGDGVFDGAEGAPTDTDLIITSLRPEHGGDQSSDLVALVAARLLRVGGTLVVLTHCDWLAGALIDPTGAVVASAQNADLLYLQHIVALHAPVRGGRFAAESLTEPDSPAAEKEARTRHRAAVRGLPAPHRRIHSDLLVFAQPHDHEPPRLSPANAARESGVIR